MVEQRQERRRRQGQGQRRRQGQRNSFSRFSQTAFSYNGEIIRFFTFNGTGKKDLVCSILKKEFWVVVEDVKKILFESLEEIEKLIPILETPRHAGVIVIESMRGKDKDIVLEVVSLESLYTLIAMTFAKTQSERLYTYLQKIVIPALKSLPGTNYNYDKKRKITKVSSVRLLECNAH